MDKTTGAILVVIGVVALFAAIVGGGIKIKEIEVGSVPSLWRQGLLGLFGIVVAVTGAVFMSESGPGSDNNNNNNNTEVANQNTEGADQSGVGNTDESSANDTNAVEPNANPDANAAEPETNTAG